VVLFNNFSLLPKSQKMFPKKILFACAPFDGHFSPLTCLAMHLKALGHDVRWYTQNYYAPKLRSLGIIHYPFVHGTQMNQENLDAIFPERKRLGSQISKLNFDLRNI